jgi:hypothetical protein
MERMLSFTGSSAPADTEVLEQVPDPNQEDQADCQRHKDVVHGICRRKVPQEHAQVAAQCAQN